MSTPAYITLEQLAQLFTAKEMTDLTGPDGPDAALIVALTNEEVHQKLSALVGTAILVDVPLSLRMKAADIARFYLYKDSVGKDSPVMLRWQQAVRTLERIAEGKETVSLTLADNPDTESDDLASAAGVWSEPGSLAMPASEWKAL